MNKTAWPEASRLHDERLRGRHILCVDDDHQSLVILTSFLESEGYGCAMAEDGANALEMLQNCNDFDLVITDVVMPNLDGHGLCSAIEREFPNLLVVVVSGSDEHEVARLRSSPVVCDVLKKPVGRRDIAGVVQSALAASWR